MGKTTKLKFLRGFIRDKAIQNYEIFLNDYFKQLKKTLQFNNIF
jgi:hypothetical protein